MTVVTGGVDAVSILRLGHVFVANMTGNIVFLGFALVGASGFSLSASLVALLAFLAGAAIGGRLLLRPSRSRPDTLRRAAAVEVVLVGAGAVVAFSAAGTAPRYAITVVLALAMGAQNAVVRKLAVADLTTTVLTMTLTGLAADGLDLGASSTRRRILAVALMLAGAVGGALVVLHVSTGLALAIAAGLLLVVAVVPGRT